MGAAPLAGLVELVGRWERADWFWGRPFPPVLLSWRARWRRAGLTLGRQVCFDGSLIFFFYFLLLRDDFKFIGVSGRRPQIAHQRSQDEEVHAEQERVGNSDGENNVNIRRLGDFFKAQQQHGNHDRSGNVRGKVNSDETANGQLQDLVQAGRECGRSQQPQKIVFESLVEFLNLDHAPKQSEQDRRLNGELDEPGQKDARH